MLFNSASFLLLFLPLALLLYYIAAYLGRDTLRKVLLIGLSLIFYAIGGMRFLPVLLASIAFNYVVGRIVATRTAQDRPALVPLAVGVCGNIALLFFFKYAYETSQSVALLFGFDPVLARIALPLAISFYTFQQIGFLVDVARKRFVMGGLLSYLNFVLFFPPMISGPIVKYDETVPQIEQGPARGTYLTNILIGLAIFAFGLFKKTVIADTIALYNNPVISGTALGSVPSPLVAWIVAFGYVAQIYFDFSGYSDMAIGVGRMFGVKLPLNFYSPLLSTGALEIWRRWHMTLGRWVRSYIFQPLSVRLARFAARRDLDGYAFSFFSTYIPTISAMVVLGVWHGAGFTYALFGLLNGIFMVVNEIWNTASKRYYKARKMPRPPASAGRIAMARGLTLLAFVLAHVAFSALNIEAAMRMYAAMIGFGSASASSALTSGWPLGFTGALVTLVISYFIIFFLPNTEMIMTRFEPALEWKSWYKLDIPRLNWTWKMRWPYAVLTGVLLFFGFAFIMRGTTSFIYFGF